MREFFVEIVWARLATCAALMLVHCAVLMLVIVSMIEVFKTIAGIIGDLEKGNVILSVGALVAVLVPSGAVLFWGCSAIATELDLPIRKVLRFLRDRRNKKFLAQGSTRPRDQGNL
jgi:hypothetical protein